MKVLNVLTTQTSCTITARFPFGTLIGTYTDNNAHKSYIKIRTIQIMKQISEELIQKTIGLLKPKVNSVNECHEKTLVLNQLENLEDVKECNLSCINQKYFYHVGYWGISTHTDERLANEIILSSEHPFTNKDIEQELEDSQPLDEVHFEVRKIQREEYLLLKDNGVMLLEDLK